MKVAASSSLLKRLGTEPWPYGRPTVLAEEFLDIGGAPLNPKPRGPAVAPWEENDG